MTYIEFLNFINPRQELYKAMMENISEDRKFFSVKMGDEWIHGLWDKEDCKKLSSY